MDFTTIQGIIALFTTLVLVGQLIIGFFVGADSDIDINGGDASDDFDISTIFSPKGILHFVCGSSWYLVCVGKSVLDISDYIIASLIGLLFMGIMVGVYYLMYKLQCYHIREKGTDLIGRTGTINFKYRSSNISTEYVISIVINGSVQEIVVKSEFNNIYQAGEQVTIKKYENGFYYI